MPGATVGRAVGPPSTVGRLPDAGPAAAGRQVRRPQEGADVVQEEKAVRIPRTIIAALSVAALVVAACGGGASPTPSPAASPSPQASPSPVPSPSPGAFKACQVSDTGGIDDKSFNQNAWKGMQDAQAEFGIEIKFLESRAATDYARNIQQFISEGCDIIITVGFLLGDDTKKAAEANPNVRFAIVDFAYDPPVPNIEGLVYATDEAAMLAGYVSAAWSKTGKLATYGGINIPPVTAFMDGFVAGANYYNKQKGKNVTVLGWDPVAKTGSFTGNFESTDDAKNLTLGFLQEGADVILPVGGPIGKGTFAAIEETGAQAVGLGVDVDWTITVPEYKQYMLTSIIKKIDVSVKGAIERALKGEAVQPVFVSTLKNGGVDIAPFHDYDSQISAETKAELEALRQAIIDGSVKVADYLAK
jgi:basic membrane protein A